MANIFLKLCNDPSDPPDALLIKGESLDGTDDTSYDGGGKPVHTGHYHVIDNHGHYKEIELHSWHWDNKGITNSATFKEANSKDAASKTTVNEIVVVKGCDAASVPLVQFCTGGKPIPYAVITCRKNADDFNGPHRYIEYLVVTLQNVMISGILLTSEETGVAEHVNLNFERFDMTYKPQPNKSADAQGTFDTGWIIAKHEESQSKAKAI